MLHLLTLVLAMQAASGATVSEAPPVAQILKITVDAQDRAEATDTEVQVIRAATSRLDPARRSLLLFENDLLTTGANVSVVLSFLEGAAESEKTAVVGPATQIRVRGRASLGLILGRILANVRGFFELERPEGTLGAQGTEFEVVGGSEGSTELLVLEGAVEVKGASAPGAKAPEPAAARLAVTAGRASSSSVSVTVRNGCKQDHFYEIRAPENLPWVSLLGERFPVAPGSRRTLEMTLKLDASRLGPGVHRGDIVVTCLDCGEEPGCSVSSEPVKLEVAVKGEGEPSPPAAPAVSSRVASRLEKLALPRGRWSEPALKATDRDVDSAVAWSSSVLLAGRPAYSRRGSALYMESVEERNRVFREARFRAVWLQSAPDYERLGNIYCDWGEGAKGLEAYQRAARRSPALQSSADHAAALAEAYRLKGRLKEADARLLEALRAGPRPAFTLVTLGNLRLDQARVSIDRGEVAQARRLLEESLDAFVEAGRSKERRDVAAVALANRGDALLAHAELDRQEGKPDAALRRLEEARRSFESAQEIHSAYPYSDPGLADVLRGYFGVAAARGDKERAESLRRQSEERYRRAIEAKRAPFAAWTGLGSLCRDAGQDERAIEAFSRALELRPGEPLAHYRLAVALAKADPRRAALHARAFLDTEPEELKQGRRARTASALASAERTPPPPPPPPPTTRAPALSGLSLEAAERALRAADLERGDVARRLSNRPEGTVIDQSPKAGETVAPRSRVDLVLAEPAPTSAQVRVPNVEGEPQENALDELRRRRLLPRVQGQESCGGYGRVLSQKPGPGTTVPEGSAVTLAVASPGDRPVRVPEVRRMPRSQAEALLAKSDLKVRVRTRRAASVPPDLVLDQEPQANEVVARGCPVELLVAEPEPLVRVPDLHGLSEKEALSRLSTLGLTRGRIEGSGTGGKVVKQDPEPQAPIARGSPVHVWIRPDSRPQPDLVPVPDVAGRELKAAADMVRRAGLSPVFQGKGACVGRQSPSARARVRPGSPVTLYAGTCPVR